MINFDKKKYMKEYMRNYLGTPEGFLTKQYARFNERKMCEITKKDFIEWSLNNQKFNSLFKNWLHNDRATALKPSVDRIDDYGTYNLNNIQWLTWEENRIKGINCEKTKPTRKNLTSYTKSHVIKVRVLELNKDFESISECANYVGLATSFVCRCIKGTRKSVDYTFIRLGVNQL